MPARQTRYNRQSRAIDQKSDSLKNKVVTKQTESKIQEARRNQQEKIEQREQEREQVIAQQDGEVIKSTSISKLLSTRAAVKPDNPSPITQIFCFFIFL